ncbi:MAG: DUF4058 family protein [Pyrinomonadaceae bacterium]|nr:DUF4058 family protein [Phycisphaerales bacterium]
MPSPFPGMDPYLEIHRLDVLGRLASRSVEALNGALPTELAASIASTSFPSPCVSPSAASRFRSVRATNPSTSKTPPGRAP